MRVPSWPMRAIGRGRGIFLVQARPANGRRTEFRCLGSFSPSAAPRTFTVVLKVECAVASSLHSRAASQLSEMKVTTLLKHRFVVRAALCLTATALLLATGCSKATPTGAPANSPGVEVAQVEQKDVPIYSEWIGTLDGMVNADIKAQVSGYLLKQDYTEGSPVKKDQLLFEIDARPFRAALDQALGQLAQANGQLAQAKAQLLQSEAQVAQAQANQVRAQLDEDRYAPLMKQHAISQ